MKPGAAGTFGARLKELREAAGFTQEELGTMAGLSVHAVSLERGERRRPQLDTVRALSAALDLPGPSRDAFLASARAPAHASAVEASVRARGRPARAAGQLNRGESAGLVVPGEYLETVITK
jgi:transcriptional regulator with XRE-family HTH domain